MFLLLLMVTNLWIQNGEEEEDEEVSWDGRFIQANGRPAAFGPLLLLLLLFFFFFFFFFNYKITG